MHFQERAHASPPIKQWDSWKVDLKSPELFTTSPGDTRATHFPTIPTTPSQHNTTRFAQLTPVSPLVPQISAAMMFKAAAAEPSGPTMQTRLPAGSQYPKKPPSPAVLASPLSLLLVLPVLGRQSSLGAFKAEPRALHDWGCLWDRAPGSFGESSGQKQTRNESLAYSNNLNTSQSFSDLQPSSSDLEIWCANFLP